MDQCQEWWNLPGLLLTARLITSASICWLAGISSINPSVTTSYMCSCSLFLDGKFHVYAQGGPVFGGQGQAGCKMEMRRAQSWQITVLSPTSSALIPALMVTCPRADYKCSSYNLQGPVVAPEFTWLMRVNNCMFRFLSMSNLYQRPLVLEGCWNSWSSQEW